MKIYKVYKVYEGMYECEKPKPLYINNYDKAIKIFNDLIRKECSCIELVSKEEFKHQLKKFREWVKEWGVEPICRKYPFIMFKGRDGNIVVNIPYKAKKKCGCDGYSIEVSCLILEEIETVE